MQTSTHREITEDGDLIYTTTLTADTVKEAMEVSMELNELLARRGTNLHWNQTWTNTKDGLTTTYSKHVDGTEDAIERNNDYRAWLRGDE